MLIPFVGTRVADLVRAAIEVSSAPKIAVKAGLGTQALYNYRDGRLPSRLAIPALAKGMGLSRDRLTELVEADRRDRQRVSSGPVNVPTGSTASIATKGKGAVK